VHAPATPAPLKVAMRRVFILRADMRVRAEVASSHRSSRWHPLGSGGAASINHPGALFRQLFGTKFPRPAPRSFSTGPRIEHGREPVNQRIRFKGPRRHWQPSLDTPPVSIAPDHLESREDREDGSLRPLRSTRSRAAPTRRAGGRPRTT
jgi:hypothetical protein